MSITVEIRMTPNLGDGVACYASLVFDGWLVVHDVKLIRRREPGNLGDRFLVAMPSKKITHVCPNCTEKNPLRANYCNGCGESLKQGTPPEPNKWFADMVHPIDPEGRRRIHFAVLSAYRLELTKQRETRELPTDRPAEASNAPQEPRPLAPVGETGGPGNDRGEVGG